MNHAPRLATFLAEHERTLRALLPALGWPLPLLKTEQFGPLTKYTLGEARPGVWAMLHRLTETDEGLPHDHPVRFEAHVLSGGYIEKLYRLLPGGTVREMQQVWRPAGSRHVIEPQTIHRLVELPAGESWSLCLAGPVERAWRHYVVAK